MSSANLHTLAELRENGPPEFFERNPIALRDLFVAKYQGLTNKTLFEGQPEMFIMEMLAYAFSVDNSGKQHSVEQNTVVWAEGDHLENRAANVSIFRLKAQPAQATLLFFREQPVPFDIAIAKGTIVSGGGIDFATDADVVLAAGALNAEISATALTLGVAGNGITAFSINVPAVELPEGVAVHNTTLTNGGSDIEEQERFRERAANGNFKISRGGPRHAYREIVKGLHPDIVDVGIIRPEPGHIHIHPLMRDGVPSAEIKADVVDGLDPEHVVSMGDFISVLDPVGKVFNPTAIVRVDTVDSTIEDRAAHSLRAVFDGWSQTMGARIAPSSLAKQVRELSANVIDVEIQDLPFTDLKETEFAVLGQLDVVVEVRPNA